ncbi:MAG: terminase small subunit [Nanoarchaeota archaeon]|nr:terminase small subunit [Nanoarchaeota archaeon]
MTKKPRKSSARNPTGQTLASNTLTIQQSNWLNEYLKTGNGFKSYKNAYTTKGMNNKSIYNEAQRLIHHPVISKLINEYKGNQIDKMEFDREMALSEFEEARLGALAKEDYATAVSATTGKCKLFGLMNEKKTIHIEHNNFVQMLRDEANQLQQSIEQEVIDTEFEELEE